MLKKDLPPCPVELTLLLISNKWKILIISSKKSPTSISRGWIAFLVSWNCFKNMI